MGGEVKNLRQRDLPNAGLACKGARASCCCEEEEHLFCLLLGQEEEHPFFVFFSEGRDAWKSSGLQDSASFCAVFFT